MNSLYNLALRQSASIQSELTLIESTSAQSASFSSLSGQLNASFAALSRTVDDYESMAKRELSVQKREKALQRVKKFREEEREMRSSFQNIRNGRGGSGSANNPSIVNTNGGPRSPLSASMVSQAAAAVSSSTSASSSGGPVSHNNPSSPFTLHARTATQGPAASQSTYSGALPPQDRPDPLNAYRMNASAAAMFGGGEGGAMSAREGYALREHSFIQQTETQLDGFIAQGREVWSNLTEQRDILKGTQRRLRDVGVTLGLSRNVIGYIERRSTQDTIIFAVGAVFTLVCFYYIYKWFG